MNILIEKYVTDTITEDELDILYTWLQDPEHQQLFKTYIQDHYDLNISLSKVKLNDTYDDLRKKIQQYDQPHTRLFTPWFKYAAIGVGLVGISYLLYIIFNINNLNPNSFAQPQVTLVLEDGSVHVLDEEEQTVITHKDGHTVVKQEHDKLWYREKIETDIVPSYNQLIVPYGKRFEVSLSDGTVAFLNSGTKFRYPKAFTTNHSREVFLNGEAYFQVKSAKEWPFIVHTDEMEITVFGTSFNVSAYEDENNTAVVLVTGNVSVAHREMPRKLFDIDPGQQALLEYGKLSINKVYVEKHIAWVDGKLSFINDRFEDILRELERHYNITIINKYKALNEIKYTGTFKAVTLEEILTVFKTNTLLDYKIKDQTVIIMSKEKI